MSRHPQTRYITEALPGVTDRPRRACDDGPIVDEVESRVVPVVRRAEDEAEFGERLRQARIRAGLSQGELATRLGVSQPTVSKWERNATPPKPAVRQTIHELLDLGRSAEDAAEGADAETVSGSPYGAWLTRARERLGMTRRQLSERSGLREPHIWKIEAGRISNPRPETRRKLEQGLGENAPPETVRLTEEDAAIEDVGTLTDFDPHDESDRPAEPGIYVFYDISERPIYVGESQNIRGRVADHAEKFWFRAPVVEGAAYVRIEDARLRRQVEQTMIRFLKSNAVINRQGVDRP